MIFKILFSAFVLTIVLRGSQCFHTWILQSDIGSDVANKSSHETLLKELAKKSVPELSYHLLTELQVMGTGNDFYGFGEADGTNEDLHAKSFALVTLFNKVYAAEKVYGIMRAAARYGAEQVKTTGEIKNVMIVLLDKAEALLRNDSALYSEYSSAKEEAKKPSTGIKHEIYYGVIPATEQEAEKIVYKFANHPFRKKALANAVFHNQTKKANAVSVEAHKLAKAILEVTKNPEKRNAVQTLYDAALYETVKTVGDIKQDDPEHNYHSYVKQLSIELVKVLEAKFKADPLGADVEEAKKRIASEIGGTDSADPIPLPPMEFPDAHFPHDNPFY